ncbi:glycosyltransferase [Gracilibacillus caseinilyticus]|uniref:Glycosyltransferase n=1 Tax=Gracilibacillus caseinilyticus TaxID=2932256 RepID=A0ABY4F2M7_9BACI|nr:glycosyltransferase [Gracilibacillus caseinilyticus]UOQ50327.1 glycosyltransferase [Gracilibacillus caseinilyticus]
MNDLISVIMSTYNENRSELFDSINSILNQSYKNLEFIIVLDKPDNFEIKKILDEFKINDSRIKVIFNKKNLGLAESLNEGIYTAKGTFLARMDADDIAFPDRIEKQLNYIKNYDFDMISTNRIDIDESGKEISNKSSLPKNSEIHKLLPVGNFINHPTVFIKKEVIKKVGGYRNFKSAQDYDLWLRLLSSGYKIGILDEPLLYYRIRNQGISQSDKYRQFLFTQYQQKLFYERMEGKEDSFSEENLELFLNKNRYNDPVYKEKFNTVNQKLEKGLLLLKRKEYRKSFALLLQSMLLNKHVAKKFFSIMKYKIYSS